MQIFKYAKPHTFPFKFDETKDVSISSLKLMKIKNRVNY